MKQVRIINIEETIGKTVGRRLPPDPLCPKNHSIASSKSWKKAFPYGYPRRSRIMEEEEYPSESELTTREPSTEDLVNLLFLRVHYADQIFRQPDAEP